LNFVKDVGDRPTGRTLDRINPSGNYTKKNTRWATPSEQAANRRNSNKVVGVCKMGLSWVASLQINSKIYRKNFKKYEDAVECRKKLETKYLNNNKK